MAPAFGYTYAYEYPSDSLKVLGFGDIDAKDLNYNIEVDADGVKEIQYDVDYSTAGLPLRFVKNITDVTKFSPEFTLGLAILLAEKTALQITQDQRKADAFAAKVPGKLSEISGMNAQENPPIRRSESKFKRARYSDPVRNNEKL